MLTYAPVKVARELQSVKIVSFDWLEDSLMKMTPRNEREYLMSAKTKTHKDAQKKKKALREKNIQKGRKPVQALYYDGLLFPRDML